MKKKNVIIKEDRISELPELIVENILLRLVSSKDRVRVSVLSKRWCALTASFPFLDFNFDEFVKGVYGTSYRHVARYLFYKYVEHSVSRFCCQQNLKKVHTFKLCAFFEDDKEVDIINQCLELILEKGLKVLDIDITVYAFFEDDKEVDIINMNTPSLILFSYANEKNFLNPYFNRLKVTRLQPYELEHVELKLCVEKALTVLDGLLWCCCPRSLSLTSNFSFMSDKKRGHFLKFISGKLLQKEDQGTTNIRIEWSFPSESNIYFSWNSMLPELPDRYKQTLTFIKEEVYRHVPSSLVVDSHLIKNILASCPLPKELTIDFALV
ncbi:F-box domain containing protein [Tanacetum coccineum]|uniref:F-box domain containing protein n=1 Tax=Tanacetum coccineum TaxID=301880 RepID=A0ABQ4WU83_9ASTR